MKPRFRVYPCGLCISCTGLDGFPISEDHIRVRTRSHRTSQKLKEMLLKKKGDLHPVEKEKIKYQQPRLTDELIRADLMLLGYMNPILNEKKLTALQKLKTYFSELLP